MCLTEYHAVSYQTRHQLDTPFNNPISILPKDCHLHSRLDPEKEFCESCSVKSNISQKSEENVSGISDVSIVDSIEKNSSTEITITDPRHPLFGRSFRILSINNFYSNRKNIDAIYEEHVTFRIPISATNLENNSWGSSIKLTQSSVEDLVSLTKEYGFLCSNLMLETLKQ